MKSLDRNVYYTSPRNTHTQIISKHHLELRVNESVISVDTEK